MKIVYLTTIRHPEDYDKFLSKNKKAPNPSNQNFHTKLTNTLITKHEVKIISSRPMSRELFVGKLKKDNFSYPGYLNIPAIRNVNIIISIFKEIKNEKPDVIFVDVMNVTMLRIAQKAKKHLKVKVIGILTDNPLNISNTGKQYSEDVFKLSKICDGFLSLTNGLNSLFNSANKPFILIPGFIDNLTESMPTKQKYAFFAGALYPRYGVDELIKTFRENIGIPLLIAGHGPLSETLTKDTNPNIQFLGQITPQKALEYSQNALININPRPIDSQIDLFSVPSKVLDYINSGTITISTQNSEIHNLVGDNIYWIDSPSSTNIKFAVADILSNYDYWFAKALLAKKTLSAELDPQIIINKINELLSKI